MREVHVRRPDEATAEECEALVRLVAEGGAMTAAAVRAGLPRAEMLVFCAEHGGIRGVAALKVPLPGYRAGLEARSGRALPEAAYPREFGYLAVDPACRRQGIGTMLATKVLRLAGDRGLFATTGDDVARHIILPRLGFVDAGPPWQGRIEPVFLMLRAGAGA